jgi:hypothetical protein
MENNELLDIIDSLREENDYLRDTLIVALVKLSQYQEDKLDEVDEYFAGFGGGNRFN